MTRSLFWRGVRWLCFEHLRIQLEPDVRADGLVVDYPGVCERAGADAEAGSEIRG